MTHLIGQFVISRSATLPSSSYVVCAGQQLPIAAYQNLFSVVGFSFGGNGSSTFGLPDLRNHPLATFGQNTIFICTNGEYPPMY